MSERLKEWLSRLASISGDARQALVRFAIEYDWDLQDFDEGFVRKPVPRVLKDILSPYEIAVVQRVWKSDFEQSQWRKGTFDFLCGAPLDNLRTSACNSPVRRRTPKQFLGGAETFWLNHPELVRAQSETGRPRSQGAQVRRPLGVLPRTPQARPPPYYDDYRTASRPAPRQARESSNRWHEAEPCVAERDFVVNYMGGLVEVAANDTYYIDRCGRVLVGWDGTTDPPRGMNGQALVNVDDMQNRSHRVPRAQNIRRRPQSAGCNRSSQVKQRAPILSTDRWGEAQARRAECDFVVRHGWEYIDVLQGDIYYVDNSGKVLVGSEGSVSPPVDRDGRPLVTDPDFPARSPAIPWSTVIGYDPARPRLSSSFWEQATPQVSNRSFMVKYGDGELRVPANQVYYTDNMGRVLVGWKGSYSPPRDADGQPLV